MSRTSKKQSLNPKPCVTHKQVPKRSGSLFWGALSSPRKVNATAYRQLAADRAGMWKPPPAKCLEDILGGSGGRSKWVNKGDK